MSKTSKLDAAAAAGFADEANPHLYSSAMWYAHELGRAFKACGRPSPTDVRMSRGYSIKCRDMLFKIGGDKSVPTFERVS